MIRIVYLRILSVLYAYGGLTHWADLLGFSKYINHQDPGMTFADFPMIWKIGTVFFAVLDVVAAVGLWRDKSWGVAVFLLLAGIQLVMYIGFPHVFGDIPFMIYFHVVTVGLFFLVNHYFPRTKMKPS